MTPIEFVLWLNGAAELVGDQPPTPEQWATMREKLGETVGGLVAARLLERAEETLRADERRKKEGAEMFEAMKQVLESMKTQRVVGIASGLAGYQAQMEMYKAQADLEAQKTLGLDRALPAGTNLGVPETPEPHNPGLLNRILGKTTT
jgi:hypothetical protein